ncbi:hypothetical protein D3C79_683100 [compost metagenome]
MRGALAGVDVELIAGEALEHRLLTWGQQVLVLPGIGGADHHQRLLRRERVGIVAVAGGCDAAGLEAARPGRDAAVGIGRTLAAHGVETAVKLAGISPFGIHRRLQAGHKQGKNSRQFFHWSSHQKLTFRLTEAKSRSSRVVKSFEPKKSL